MTMFEAFLSRSRGGGEAVALLFAAPVLFLAVAWLWDGVGPSWSSAWRTPRLWDRPGLEVLWFFCRRPHRWVRLRWLLGGPGDLPVALRESRERELLSASRFLPWPQRREVFFAQVRMSLVVARHHGRYGSPDSEYLGVLRGMRNRLIGREVRPAKSLRIRLLEQRLWIFLSPARRVLPDALALAAIQGLIEVFRRASAERGALLDGGGEVR